MHQISDFIPSYKTYVGVLQSLMQIELKEIQI